MALHVTWGSALMSRQQVKAYTYRFGIMWYIRYRPSEDPKTEDILTKVRWKNNYELFLEKHEEESDNLQNADGMRRL